MFKFVLNTNIFLTHFRESKFVLCTTQTNIINISFNMHEFIYVQTYCDHKLEDFNSMKIIGKCNGSSTIENPRLIFMNGFILDNHVITINMVD